MKISIHIVIVGSVRIFTTWKWCLRISHLETNRFFQFFSFNTSNIQGQTVSRNRVVHRVIVSLRLGCRQLLISFFVGMKWWSTMAYPSCISGKHPCSQNRLLSVYVQVGLRTELANQLQTINLSPKA